MKSYRCADCGEPVAGFVDRVPSALPFSRAAALAMVGEGLRRHRPHCAALAAAPTQERTRAAG